MVAERPPLSSIDTIATRDVAAIGEATFHIETSGPATGRRTSIPPTWQRATRACASCGSADRRYRYPFLNCTHCGPRFTIIESLPYDSGNDHDAPLRDVRGVPAR